MGFLWLGFLALAILALLWLLKLRGPLLTLAAAAVAGSITRTVPPVWPKPRGSHEITV